MSVLGAGITAPLPTGYATAVGTANQLAVPGNPTRGGLWFINNSATQIISICPSVQYVIASGTAPAGPGSTVAAGLVAGPTTGVPGTNAAGSVTLAPGQAQIIDNQNCAGAWNAISSAPGGALTVLEF